MRRALAMVAGEASGDLLAGLLLGGVQARWPRAATFGIGGPRMTRARLRGLVAVGQAGRARLLSRCCATIARSPASATRWRERLLQHTPDAFIGVDAPDFNLGLAQRLREAGQRTIHFVCPSIWAWRAGRVKKIARSGRPRAVPVSVRARDPARAHGVAATYVGHPLADEIPLQPPRAASRAALGLGDADTVVAVLPGSRRSEIEAIAPLFLQAVARLHAQRPGLRFVLPVAPGLRGAARADARAACAPACR